MINDYVRKVHSALMNRKEKIIIVHECRLTTEDKDLIKELEIIFNKTVKLSTLQEILNNKDDNVYIVE